MTRARTKAMKEALNCLTRELNQMEPIYLEESSFLMSKKSPAKLVTDLSLFRRLKRAKSNKTKN